jgi:hypothetical protein
VPSTGFKLPNNAADGNIYSGGSSWNNPFEIIVGGFNTTCSLGPFGDTNSLEGFDFDFSSIPNDATIDGIEVRITRKTDFSNEVDDSQIKLMRTSVAISGSDNKAAAGFWPTTLQSKTYGGSTQDWTANLTVSDVKDSSFGVYLVAKGHLAGATAEVDTFEMNVHYTEASSSSSSSTSSSSSVSSSMSSSSSSTSSESSESSSSSSRSSSRSDWNIFYVEIERLITSSQLRDAETLLLYDIIIATIGTSSLSDRKGLKTSFTESYIIGKENNTLYNENYYLKNITFVGTLQSLVVDNFGSVDSFYETEDIIVSSTFAELSELAGYPISQQYIEDVS